MAAAKPEVAAEEPVAGADADAEPDPDAVAESGAGEGEGSSATASDGAEPPEDAVQGDC